MSAGRIGSENSAQAAGALTTREIEKAAQSHLFDNIENWAAGPKLCRIKCTVTKAAILS